MWVGTYTMFKDTICGNLIKIDPMICSFRSLLKDLTKSHTKVKFGDLSIMHDNNVMLRRKLSFDWLKIDVNE